MTGPACISLCTPKRPSASAGLVLPKHPVNKGVWSGRRPPGRPLRRSFLAASAAHGLQNFGWGREPRLGGSRSAELQATAAAAAAAEQQEAEAGGGRGAARGGGGALAATALSPPLPPGGSRSQPLCTSRSALSVM